MLPATNCQRQWNFCWNEITPTTRSAKIVAGIRCDEISRHTTQRIAPHAIHASCFVLWISNV